MTERQSSSFAVPDVDGALDIEDSREFLKRHIENKCTTLLHRAIAINAAATQQFRIRFWENRIDQLKQGAVNAFSLSELEELKQQASSIEAEMEQFCKRLR